MLRRFVTSRKGRSSLVHLRPFHSFSPGKNFQPSNGSCHPMSAVLFYRPTASSSLRCRVALMTCRSSTFPSLSSDPVASSLFTQCRGTVSAAYAAAVPCARFDVSTKDLARITDQPTLPPRANIYIVDLRKKHISKLKKKPNPRRIMSRVIAAHNAEKTNALAVDATASAVPPLIFLVKSDDTAKQAARRQQVMDEQLKALNAYGEFRVCVLSGPKSRHWSEYVAAEEETSAEVNASTKDGTAPEKNATGGEADTTSESARAAVAAAAVAGVLDGAAASAAAAAAAKLRELADARTTSDESASTSHEATQTDEPQVPLQEDIMAEDAREQIAGSGAPLRLEKATQSKEAEEDEEEWEEVEEEVEEEEAEEGVAGYSEAAQTPPPLQNRAHHETEESALADHESREGFSATTGENVVKTPSKSTLDDTAVLPPIPAAASTLTRAASSASSHAPVTAAEPFTSEDAPAQAPASPLPPLLSDELEKEVRQSTDSEDRVEKDSDGEIDEGDDADVPGTPEARAMADEAAAEAEDGADAATAVEGEEDEEVEFEEVEEETELDTTPLAEKLVDSFVEEGVPPPSATPVRRAQQLRATMPLSAADAASAKTPQQEALEEFDLDGPILSDAAPAVSALNVEANQKDMSAGDSVHAPASRVTRGEATRNPDPATELKVEEEEEEKEDLVADPVPRVNKAREPVAEGKESLSLAPEVASKAAHLFEDGEAAVEAVVDKLTTDHSVSTQDKAVMDAVEASTPAVAATVPDSTDASAVSTANSESSQSPPTNEEVAQALVSLPVPPTPMPVYPDVSARLYNGASTVYLSDRVLRELPLTANVLVVDRLDWDDSTEEEICAALANVDPVAGPLLFYRDAYAPQSTSVVKENLIFRDELIPFIFAFRTNLSRPLALTLQRRFIDALRSRPPGLTAEQQAVLAGQRDRTFVCVLCGEESEVGGENPLEDPELRHRTIAAAPPQATNSHIYEEEEEPDVEESSLYEAAESREMKKSADTAAEFDSGDALQRLWSMMDAPTSTTSARGVGLPTTTTQTASGEDVALKTDKRDAFSPSPSRAPERPKHFSVPVPTYEMEDEDDLGAYDGNTLRNTTASSRRGKTNRAAQQNPYDPSTAPPTSLPSKAAPPPILLGLLGFEKVVFGKPSAYSPLHKAYRVAAREEAERNSVRHETSDSTHKEKADAAAAAASTLDDESHSSELKTHHSESEERNESDHFLGDKHSKQSGSREKSASEHDGAGSSLLSSSFEVSEKDVKAAEQAVLAETKSSKRASSHRASALRKRGAKGHRMRNAHTSKGAKRESGPPVVSAAATRAELQAEDAALEDFILSLYKESASEDAAVQAQVKAAAVSGNGKADASKVSSARKVIKSASRRKKN